MLSVGGRGGWMESKADCAQCGGSGRLDGRLIVLVWEEKGFGWKVNVPGGTNCTQQGQAVVTLLMRKYRRQSFIVLSIGLVIALSTCLMGFQVSDSHCVRDALLWG